MFHSDILQRGFNQTIGCSDAIFTIKSMIFCEAWRLCICSSLIDTKKAFDKVNHFKLSSVLLDAIYPNPSC